jgi:hypothetical protein
VTTVHSRALLKTLTAGHMQATWSAHGGVDCGDHGGRRPHGVAEQQPLVAVLSSGGRWRPPLSDLDLKCGNKVKVKVSSPIPSLNLYCTLFCV